MRKPSICQTHVGYPSKASAKMAIRIHRKFSCGKCRGGQPIEMFLCSASGHYHIGHRPVLARGMGVTG